MRIVSSLLRDTKRYGSCELVAALDSPKVGQCLAMTVGDLETGAVTVYVLQSQPYISPLYLSPRFYCRATFPLWHLLSVVPSSVLLRYTELNAFYCRFTSLVGTDVLRILGSL
ncbi:hypothetical protein J6590_008465 [Homalodisca vitripennis]|nr:hypothetical protein J6590_008465 [Homalodisca vitripennis]